MHQHAQMRQDPDPAEPALPLRIPVSVDAEAAIKNLAKAMARDTTAGIPDRHVRAEVRTTCYNQFVTVLKQLDERQATQHQRHKRALAVLGIATAMLTAALVLSLMV